MNTHPTALKTHTTHTNSLSFIIKVPPTHTLSLDYTMSSENGSLSSAEELRLLNLETEVQSLKDANTQMLSILMKQTKLLQALQSKPEHKVSALPQSKPVTKTVAKKAVVKVDENREKLITQFYELGFNKRSVNAGMMSDTKIEEYIQSMVDGTFTEYDLLTNEGLYKLCLNQGIKAKPTMSKSVLLSLLNPDQEEEENEEEEWQMTRSFLKGKNLSQLKDYCRDNEIKGFSTKKKDELIDLILSKS